MLNRAMGTPQGAFFDTWILYFIDEIATREVMMNWARIISDNIKAQLRNLR